MTIDLAIRSREVADRATAFTASAGGPLAAGLDGGGDLLAALEEAADGQCYTRGSEADQGAGTISKLHGDGEPAA